MAISGITNYFFRLALVVNTSHKNFNDNLTSIVIYILYSNKGYKIYMNIDEIQTAIFENLGLEFTSKEISQCIGANCNYFVEFKDNSFSLSDEGAKKIHETRNDEMQEVIKRYKKVYGLEESTTAVTELLYSFLYDSLGQNINELLKVIQGSANINLSSLNTEKYSNSQRKIINDFIDWDDKEKNDLLFQLISFAVDYCRLTVKKDSNSFKTILNGKKFYLDANIIFRIMGLNNIQRKRVVSRFIDRCKDSNIKLCYTSLTKTEVLESIRFHINDVKRNLSNYRGKGESVKGLIDRTETSDGFLSAYLSWCGDTNGYGKYDDFEEHLRSLFFQAVEGISLEEVADIKVTDDEIDSYFAAKNGKTSKETAICDIKNIHYILKKRRMSSVSEGWNTKEYLISADHKLIDWSMEKYSSSNPVVVLPSVWYSTILKITGRSTDDEKSFVEFIKLRYMQNNAEDNIKFLISTVCNKTPNGILQDKLFTEISENNEILNQISTAHPEEIPQIVDTKYENILENTKNEGYIVGKQEGIKSGEKIGYQDGLTAGKLSGKEIGEKIGRLKQQKDELEKKAVDRAIKRQRRNILIVVIGFVFTLLLAFFIFKKYVSPILSQYDQYLSVICTIASFLVATPIGFIVSHIFILDLEKLALL